MLCPLSTLQWGCNCRGKGFWWLLWHGMVVGEEREERISLPSMFCFILKRLGWGFFILGSGLCAFFLTNERQFEWIRICFTFWISSAFFFFFFFFFFGFLFCSLELRTVWSSGVKLRRLWASLLLLRESRLLLYFALHESVQMVVVMLRFTEDDSETGSVVLLSSVEDELIPLET